jgi:hypothetical protein
MDITLATRDPKIITKNLIKMQSRLGAIFTSKKIIELDSEKAF